ncbi:MAG: anti-phage deoxyguanosine triphosphatase [Nitrospirales bacterium]|nr:deoxyguanosinetriphosphate triphosphohydrolase family protein [Nitrospirales bacterium]
MVNEMNDWIARRGGGERKPFNSLNSDSDYQRDRARVIHSSAFRRLQSKTQVLGIGESDFYRTRLTHSLEAAQIGSGICEHLGFMYQSQVEHCRWIPTQSLIETICLSHDIGHPPFGHGGEVALHNAMAIYGGFEGNGQTLRIISKLGEYSPNNGFDLTRRAMLGVIKYPCLYSRIKSCEQHSSEMEKGPFQIKGKPPKCVYDDEDEVLEWVLKPFAKEEILEFTKHEIRRGKHGKALYKSFDASILELADDIAYGVHDLEDALALSLVSEQQWRREVSDKIETLEDCEIKRDLVFYKEKLFSESNKERKQAISKLVGFFISNIKIIEQGNFQHPLLRHQAALNSPANPILKLFKNFVIKHVIKRPEVQVLEYKGQLMIARIFEVLKEDPMRFLPVSTQQKYQEAANKERVLSDYISGMTDSYSTKLYHKLFSPSIGSIFDRL